MRFMVEFKAAAWTCGDSNFQDAKAVLLTHDSQIRISRLLSSSYTGIGWTWILGQSEPKSNGDHQLNEPSNAQGEAFYDVRSCASTPTWVPRDTTSRRTRTKSLAKSRESTAVFHTHPRYRKTQLRKQQEIAHERTSVERARMSIERS